MWKRTTIHCEIKSSYIFSKIRAGILQCHVQPTHVVIVWHDRQRDKQVKRAMAMSKLFVFPHVHKNLRDFDTRHTHKHRALLSIFAFSCFPCRVHDKRRHCNFYISNHWNGLSSIRNMINPKEAGLSRKLSDRRLSSPWQLTQNAWKKIVIVKCCRICSWETWWQWPGEGAIKWNSTDTTTE